MAENPFKSLNEPEDPSLPSRNVTSINEPPDGDNVEPLIDTLEPASCVIGDADFTLYVHGDNFFPSSVISFAGHDEPTTLNEDGTLSTEVRPSLWLEPVVADVVVRNGSLESPAAEFAFTGTK